MSSLTISSKVGFGEMVTGEIVVLGEKHIDSRDLAGDLAGKIILLLCWAPRAFLEKASLLRVSGIVIPSIHYRDYAYFEKHRDFTLLVLDKFGRIDAHKDLLTKLLKLSGKTAELDGEGKSLLIK